jgi:hypothetical protein
MKKESCGAPRPHGWRNSSFERGVQRVYRSAPARWTYGRFRPQPTGQDHDRNLGIDALHLFGYSSALHSIHPIIENDKIDLLNGKETNAFPC